MRVLDRTVVVTGGGSGIGRELVLGLLIKGARVAAVDVDDAALLETSVLARDNDSSLSTHVVDITSRCSVSELPRAVIARHGSVDGLINNAGIIQPFVRVCELDNSAIERVMDVNFRGTLEMTRAFLPPLLERPEGHIANVSSMGGFLPVPGQTLYGASKAAVKLFTEGLSAELADTNITVTVVFPGAIDTDIAGHSDVDLDLDSGGGGIRRLQRLLKPMSPRKAAEMIIHGIERNRYRVLVGSDAVFMDFAYRVSPKWATRLISMVMQPLLSR